jgi:hypothetical protein
MTNMKRQNIKKYNERGAALLIVLFIVMAITVLSLGFLARSDTELACGQNMALHTQMDSLAYSGLEHARGLILYPQDVDAAQAYWTGGSALQLPAGNDYYDVNVVMHNSSDPDPTYRCTYNVKSEAYLLKKGQKAARSAVEGELRLDPCIAYGSKASTAIPPRITIKGDMYCGGSVLNMGTIYGDVFASALSGSGTMSGQTKAFSEAIVSWPNDVTVVNFKSHYPSYQTLPATVSGYSYGSQSLPQVCYRSGTLSLAGSATIDGMLIVEGDLNVSSTGNNINSGKNLPALLVTGDLVIADGAELTINGLAVIKNRVRIRASAGDLNVYGALFAENGVFETAADSTANTSTAFLYNCPTWRSAGGQVNGAIEFDGVDDYLQTANSLTKLQISNDYTFSVWIKADASQKIWAGIFSKTNTGGSINHWTLQFDTSSPRKLIIYHPSGYWETGIRLTDIAGAWHNITIVRHKTGGDSYMWSYLDGSHIKSNDKWNLAPGTADGHLNIGGDMTASSSYVFKGLIDELKIYDSSAADGSINPPNPPIGYWSLDKTGSGAVNIVAAPNKAAIVAWSGSNAVRWGQAGGAFYRYIKRN